MSSLLGSLLVDFRSLLAEFIGTAILVVLGDGVVANVLLTRTKGQGGGWIVITAGWAFAVFVAVLCAAPTSGAHINPAVTIGLAVAGKFAWGNLPGYVVAQMLGGIVGGVLVYTFYKAHYDLTEDGDLKLATFCTAPGVRHAPLNLFSEMLATFVLVYAVLWAAEPSIHLPQNGEPIRVGLGALGALPVALVVFGIGLSLGGTTGYAINPARDLGPRIAHALLPIPGKRDSDWSYCWIPVAGPVVGAILAAGLFQVFLRF